MKILALEFSSPQRSVAVANNTEVISEVVETGVGGTRAFGMIEAALREAKWEREQIECIVVGLGPGSYTGIRAALSIAQGWQLARGTKLLGISSAEAIAVQAQANNLFGRVNVVIDAQRNEVYSATYDITSQSRNEIEPLRILTLAEAQSRRGTGETYVGPEATRWFATGKILFPCATLLTQLAAKRVDFVPGEKLEPIYLRDPNFVKAPPPRVL